MHKITSIIIVIMLLGSQPAHAGTFDSTRAGARFYYDAFGRQVAKVAKYRAVPIEEDKYVDYNLSEHYLYDGTGMLMKLEAAQKNYADIKTRSFYYGNDNVSDTPQIAYVDGEPLCNLLDPGNSILASFSREGDKILYHDVGNYTEYGQPDEEASQGDPLGNRESFCGMDFDRVMGMYYDHSTNRWRDVRTKQEIQAGYNPTWTKPSPGALQIGGSVAAGVFLDSWYDVPTCLVGYDPLLGKLTGFERVAGLLPFVGSSAVRAGRKILRRVNPLLKIRLRYVRNIRSEYADGIETGYRFARDIYHERRSWYINYPTLTSLGQAKRYRAIKRRMHDKWQRWYKRKELRRIFENQLEQAYPDLEKTWAGRRILDKIRTGKFKVKPGNFPDGSDVSGYSISRLKTIYLGRMHPTAKASIIAHEGDHILHNVLFDRTLKEFQRSEYRAYFRQYQILKAAGVFLDKDIYMTRGMPLYLLDQGRAGKHKFYYEFLPAKRRQELRSLRR